MLPIYCEVWQLNLKLFNFQNSIFKLYEVIINIAMGESADANNKQYLSP